MSSRADPSPDWSPLARVKTANGQDERNLLIGAGMAKFTVGAFALSLSPLLPDVAQTLRVDGAALGLAAGGYWLAMTLAALASAPIQDRFPRLQVILTGVALHMLGALGVGLAPVWGVVVSGHILCGIGAGILLPSTVALISDTVPFERRARILGRTNIGWAASTLCGVPLAGFIGATLGWRAAPLALAALWLPIVILIASSNRRRHIAPRVEAQSPTATRKSTFELWPMFLATFALFIGFYGVYSFYGVAAREARNLSALVVSLTVLVYGLGFLFASLKTSWIDRIGKPRAFLISLLGLAAVLLALPLALATNLLAIGMCMLAWGAFQNFAFTSSTTIVSNAPPEIRAKALALNQCALSTGAATGTLVMGYVLGFTTFAVVGLLCAGITLSAALVVGRFIFNEPVPNLCANPS